MDEATHLYAIAIGSNRRHIRHGRPSGVVEAAIAELDRHFTLFDASPILLNPASGGAGRDFANAAALVVSELPPHVMLDALKEIERAFGRRSGRRWGPRVLDLDIMAWDGPPVRTRTLTIPHPHLASRAFMLGPLVAISRRLPILGSITAQHQQFRLAKAKRRK